MKYHVFIFFETADKSAAGNAAYLEEGGRTREIDNRWSVRMDPPHQPGMSQHLHVMLRGNDVSVINRDGTPSHGTNPADIPNWVRDKLKDRGLLERSYLREEASSILIPENLIERTEFRARIFDCLDNSRLMRFGVMRESVLIRTLSEKRKLIS